MDTLTQNKFAAYLDRCNNWSRSRFYYRADVTSNYFWKLKHGRKNPSPDIIVRLALATEGECQPSDVFHYFEELKQFRDVDELLRLLESQWVDETVFARSVSRFDLEERMADLRLDGHCILTREKNGHVEYRLCE